MDEKVYGTVTVKFELNDEWKDYFEDYNKSILLDDLLEFAKFPDGVLRVMIINTEKL